MTPDPKAAEDFATLVLVTARTLRRLIQEPINPRRRAAMLTELNDALAPFDDAAEPDLERHECGGCAPPVYTAKLEGDCGEPSESERIQDALRLTGDCVASLLMDAGGDANRNRVDAMRDVFSPLDKMAEGRPSVFDRFVLRPAQLGRPAQFALIHDPDCKSITGHDFKRCDCSLSRISARDDNCELPKTPEPS